MEAAAPTWLPWIYGFGLALLTAITSVTVAWLNLRGAATKKEVEILRQELSACQSKAAENLAIEADQRRSLQAELSSLKDDLARKNEDLITALINRQQYLRRSEDLKDGK